MKELSKYTISLLASFFAVLFAHLLILGGIKLLSPYFVKQSLNWLQLLYFPFVFFQVHFLEKKLKLENQSSLFNGSIVYKLLCSFIIVIIIVSLILVTANYGFNISFSLVWPTVKLSNWVFMLLMLLEVALAEEYIFRRYILNLSIPFFKNILITIIVNSILFTAIHFQSFFDGSFTYNWAIAIFFFSTFLASYTYFYKDLLLPIIVHALWDIASTLVVEDDKKFGLVHFVNYKENELLIANISSFMVGLVFLLATLMILYKFLFRRCK